MARQIAVRLPDELVDFLDDRVVRGCASSRASAVAQAIRRERRRASAARDAEILAQTEPDSDMAALAGFAARTPLDDLD